MNKVLLLSTPKKKTLKSIFASNAIFELDATIKDSYNGGQVFKNLIQSPADGAAQSAYDFNLGITSGSSTDDPTFTGTINKASSYFLMDGGDYFTLAGSPSNCPFINTIHQRKAHTFIIVLNHNNTLSQDIGLLSTCDTVQVNDRGIQYYGGWGNSFHKQRTATGLVSTSRAQTPNTAIDRVIAFSYNPTNDTITSYWNTTTGTSVSAVWNASADNRTGGTLVAIGSRGEGSKMPSGTKVYAVGLLNKTIDSTDMRKILDLYNYKHNRVYA